MIKSDLQLKNDIEHELEWDPKVNAAQIAVDVDRGVVTLFGAVDTFGEKKAAEETTKRVSGVRAVAEDLTVKTLSEHARSDSELATATLAALQWNIWVPKTITATVHDGIVTLEGTARWQHQREAAVCAVSNLKGVVQLFNFISLGPQVLNSEVKTEVEAALQRQAKSDASSIQVETSGGQVTLNGSASSWRSIEDATCAAWRAPGVTHVIDHLKVAVSP